MSQNKFKIHAGTFTLRNESEGNQALLTEKRKYVIPIYQRPYSWGEEQIRKFISDLIHSFDGEESNIEPVFIGTMQLSKPEVGNDDTFVYKVIDGQQRLTTLLLILKIINESLSISEKFDWLKSEVSIEEQQKLLNEFLSTSINELNDKSTNTYIRNAYLLIDTIKEKFSSNEEIDQNQLLSFKNFIETSIFFVVIETHTGLSQTLKIFDSINTTGLDLNGGDIFKIKLFEYLTKIKNEGDLIFDDISKVYERIDNYNANNKLHQIHIYNVLNIYRYILVGRHELGKTLMTDISANIFFERLFDTIFGLFKWKNFNKAEKVELSIEDLNRIIDALEIFNEFKYSNQINASSVRFIFETRYRRYWHLPVLLLFKFSNEVKTNKAIEEFNNELYKLFFLYSVAFAKRINDLDQFIYWDIIMGVFKQGNSIDELTLKLRSKKEGPVQHYAYPSGIEVLNRKLETLITDNSTKKNLICRLSAVLSQHNEEEQFDPKKLDEIFDWDFDVEHIQSYHDKNEKERKQIWDDWGNEINSIGNLMVLERKHNRSIGNKPYIDKITKYQISKYQIVKNLVKSNPKSWTKEDAVNRRELETRKIRNFIFS